MQASSRLASFKKVALLRLVFSGGLALVLATQFACGGSTGTQGSVGAPRFVMLYATCTVNKDYLSPYNPSVKFTPNIDRFSRESVVFSRHTTESAQSGIAYASIYSGTQADKHGVFYHPRMLSEDLYLVAEAFAENDYETFFWDGHRMASSRLGYSQGVQDGNVIGPKLLQANDVRFRRILEKLRSDSDYRALVITGFTVTHGNYQDKDIDEFVARYPEEAKGISKEELNRYKRIYYQNNAPKRYLSLDFPTTVRRLGLTREEIDKLAKTVELLYKSRVYDLDRLFGSVVSSVAKAGLIEESLIVFTADHGEALYRENALFKWHHGGQLAPEALQVPLIIRHPGSKRRPVRYEQVTRSIDVFPTMMGLSGLEIPKQVDGVDLSDAILGHKDPPELIAWVHTSLLPTIMLEEIKAYSLAYKYGPRTDPRLMWVGMRDKDMVFKLRLKENGEWGFEAFDWKTDPGELTDLYAPSDPTHQEVAQRLLKYKAVMMRGYGNVVYSPGGEKLEIPEEEAMEALRSLGYL